MPIVAKDKGNGGGYEEPPVGVAPGLCVDVIDLGEGESPFKDDKGRTKIVHQIQLVWQLEPMDDDGKVLVRTDGKPFRISKFYTLSLNEKANLRKDLDSWRGVPFTEKELEEGFDVEKLIGVQCQLTLAMVTKKQSGKTRVEVVSISPKHRADPKIVRDPEFTREMDRPGGRDTRSPAAQPGSPAAASGQKPFDDGDEDDLPF